MAIKTGWVVGDNAYIPDDGGGSGGVVIVTGTFDNEDNLVLGKTYSEIKAAYMAGYTVVIFVEIPGDATEKEWRQVTYFNEYSGTDPQSDPAAYTVVAFDLRFTATDPNGYPKEGSDH